MMDASVASSGIPGRRTLIGATIAASALGRSVTAAPQSAAPRVQNGAASFAFVGCRTTKERNARGEGIRVFRVEPANGWSEVQLVKDLVNPSFLAFDHRQRFLYVVHGDMSEISAFRVDPGSGQLTFLNRQSTQGNNPVHLVADAGNRFFVVANYATGTLAVLPRADDGFLSPVRQLLPLPGNPGPHRVEQSFSHPHEVAWDPAQRFLHVPDKGLDRIFSFRFIPEEGKLVPADPAFVQVRPGAGPRHIVFHPNARFAYVAHELDSSLGAYSYDPERGVLTPFQVVPSVPDTFTGANSAAEIDISPSGRFVFVSNRGHDSIGTYSIDESSGRVTPLEWTASEGKGPRFIALGPAGEVLYAANENSDSIVPFQVDPDTGRLARSGAIIRTGSPVCIVFSTPGSEASANG